MKNTSLLNQSSDYALRAVLFLAQRDGRKACPAKAIAKATGIRPNYLGKVLHALVSAGVLTSVRGPQGGFRLAVAAAELTLEDIAGPFQRLPERSMCLLGDRLCDAANPCVSHQHWQNIADQVTSFFRTTTIAALLTSVPPENPAAMHNEHRTPRDVPTSTSC